MSFEKSGKVSGTRRKARECALQMLFAADLVDSGLFSAVDYWSELGFDQLHPEAGGLALSFLEQLSRLGSVNSSIKTWLKKLELPEQTGELIENTKEIAHSITKLEDQYRRFISDFISTSTISAEKTEQSITALQCSIERFSTVVQERIFNGKNRYSKDDTTHFHEFREQAAGISGKNLAGILTNLQKIFDDIRPIRAFADKILLETLEKQTAIDERIKTRTEHWRIERMAIVDRNVLRLAVYEFLFLDTPHTVVINEALEIARYFSTFEATQFINGILDAIKIDIDKEKNTDEAVSEASSSQKA